MLLGQLLFRLDRQLPALLRGVLADYPALDRSIAALARHGSKTAVLLLLLVPAGCRCGRGAAARALVGVGAVYLLCDWLGTLLPRLRPCAGHAAPPGVPHAPERSFPSRHVASAVAMAVVVRPCRPRLAAGLGALAAGLAVARVATAVHYPSDVLASVLLGWLVGAALRGRPPRPTAPRGRGRRSRGRGG